MVNSASQSLAEFKSQRLGTLLGGGGSTIDPGPVGAHGMDSAQTRMARTMPKKSSSAFLNDIRATGQRTNALLMQNIRNKQQQAVQNVQSTGGVSGGVGNYRLPSGGKAQTGGARGKYGITVPAGQSYDRLAAAYRAAGMGNLTINSGGRTYAEQARLYDGYRRGLPGYNKAAPPGTSLHESGIALDIGGPLYNTNMKAAMATKQHQWMRQNAAQFGWYWVGQKFGESWHWEYHPEWGGK